MGNFSINIGTPKGLIITVVTMMGIKSSLLIFGLSLLSLSTNGDESNRHKSLSQHRIINAIEVNITQHKYYVYLQDNNHFCGGALVHVNKIVTAAHCCQKFKPPLYAYPGVNNLTELSTTRRYLAREWHSHPWFNIDDSTHDLCVVLLIENIVQNDKIAVVPLAGSPPPINSSINLVGHGSTDCSTLVDGSCVDGFSNPLMKTSMVIDHYEGPMIVVRMTPNRPCKGDGGGPWTYQGKLVAVQSHSQGSWCNGTYDYEASTMITPMREFLGGFGIYPQYTTYT